MSVRILHGNVLSFARHYKGPRFHAVLCDPPYELGFMGRKWDSSGVAFNPNTWAAIASVCKPGAMLLAFGGTRTFHRIAVAIEDAGWEIRDTVMWVYGQGFPKSHDVSKAIDREAGAQRERISGPKSGGMAALNKGNAAHGYRDSAYYDDGNMMLSPTPATAAAAQWSGYGTALKPAYEPVIVARLPLDGTVAQNAQTHGTGALAIDACRVRATDGYNEYNVTQGINTARTSYEPRRERRTFEPATNGRWPANLIHDGSDEVLTLFPEVKSGIAVRRNGNAGKGLFPVKIAEGSHDSGYGDTGSAARFFYCAKSSTSERGAGLDNGNLHPTVKPLALTEYLARLILPPELDEPRRLFVPFAGVGSECIGAMRAGWECVTGVELMNDAEHPYVDIARQRIDYYAQQETKLI